MLVFVDLGPAERLGFFLNFEHFFKSFFLMVQLVLTQETFVLFCNLHRFLTTKSVFFFFFFPILFVFSFAGNKPRI